MTLDNRVRDPRRPRLAPSPESGMTSVHGNFRKLARKNTDFRREIATTAHAQVTLMCIEPGDDIGEETHDVDQLLLLVKGHGELWLAGKVSEVPKGSLVVVAAGTRHNLVNTGEKPMRLVSVYSPPKHARGTVHATRADAVAVEPRTAKRQVVSRCGRQGDKTVGNPRPRQSGKR